MLWQVKTVTFVWQLGKFNLTDLILERKKMKKKRKLEEHRGQQTITNKCKMKLKIQNK